jgi:hypothetical protein
MEVFIPSSYISSSVSTQTVLLRGCDIFRVVVNFILCSLPSTLEFKLHLRLLYTFSNNSEEKCISCFSGFVGIQQFPHPVVHQRPYPVVGNAISLVVEV